MIDSDAYSYMKTISPKIFWQTYILFSILLGVFALYQTFQHTLALGIILWHSKWVILLGLFTLNIVGGVFGLRQLSLDAGMRWIDKLEFIPKNNRVKFFGFILVLLGFFFIWAVRLTFFGSTLPQVMPIFWVFLWASLFQALGLKLITGHKWHILFALIVLVQGLIYQIYGHLSIVTDYPFSIGYSEAGRHYYASLFQALFFIVTPFPD
jgi:hypothetical protein